MTPKSKLILIVGALVILNLAMGFDLRFTLINLVWCIPIISDLRRRSS